MSQASQTACWTKLKKHRFPGFYLFFQKYEPGTLGALFVKKNMETITKQYLIILHMCKKVVRTDKKEIQNFFIYKEIQSGAVAKSYMRKGFLIYEEMRKYFPIYV
jgi:hypothetical protein